MKYEISRASAIPSLALALALLLVPGCSSSSGGGGPSSTQPDPTAPDLSAFPKGSLPTHLAADLPLVAPKSDKDIPVFSDIVDVGPGEDVTFCSFTNVILDEATIFGESFGAQSPQGHHAILMYTTTPQEPGTGDCGSGDMGSTMLLGGTGGKKVADQGYLPTNFGVEVPAGAQLVINHHWINTSTETVHGQAMMLARRLDRGGDTVLAGNMIMLGLGWELAPMGATTYSTECTYDADVPYVMGLGHMHEFGSHVSVDVTRAAGGTENMIDEQWTTSSATGDSGRKVFSIDEPYVIHKGDTVRLTCNWENTTSAAIAFPREMCIFFGYTVDTNYVCANGSWLSASAAAAAGMGASDIGQNL